MARFWVCETCGSKKKGPDKLRKNASIRYCFTCSDVKGTLVERVCPSLNKQREVRKKRRDARKARQAAKRQALRYIVDGVDLKKRMTDLLKLRCWDGAFDGRDTPILSVRWSKAYPGGVSGSARDWDEWKICMTIGVEASYAEAEETLIHELAHLAVGCEKFHDADWKLKFQEAILEEWGVLAQGRSSTILDLNAARGIAAIRGLKAAA